MLFILLYTRTFIRYYKIRGTNVRRSLERAVRYGETLDMMYLAKDDSITKRRVNVLQVGDNSFRAYCYLRKSKRAFAIENVLALVPIIERERAVI